MELALGIVAVALLACIACGLIRACRYYVSGYARATKRDFSAVMRDPHAREVYRTSRRLVSRDDDARRVLFDVAIPRKNASAASADIVLLSRQGVGVLCVQEGRGSVYGDPEDDHWVMVGSGKGDDAERITSNLGVQAAVAADALRAYLLAESDSEERPEVDIAALAVFGDGAKTEHAAVPEGVAVVRVRDVAACLREAFARKEGSATTDEDAGAAGDGARVEDADDIERSVSAVAPPFDEAKVRKMYRALKPCANAGRGTTIDGFDAPVKPETVGWVRSVMHREHADSAAADLVRKADKLVSSKEDFDALTWDRVMEISAQLETERNPERLAELAAELRLIARTNTSLNYRFGIAQPDAVSRLSPAGLVVESTVDELVATKPDAQMHEALESTDFFDEVAGSRKEKTKPNDLPDQTGEPS